MNVRGAPPAKSEENASKIDIIWVDREVYCDLCTQNLGERFCTSCKNEKYCKTCFVKFHEKSFKKRHKYQIIKMRARAAKK